MAERRALPPPVPQPVSSPDPASSAVSTAFGSPLEPVAALPPPPSRHSPHDTYVVKVQKDQIYRVPPPENAYLAERYRSGAGPGAKQQSSSAPCVLRTVGALLVTAALVGAAIAICVVVLRPGLPGFSVDGLSVAVHDANGQQPRRVDYDAFLTAVNPNKMTALWYRDGGAARLLHEGVVLAKGVVGQPADGGEDATDFSVVMHGVALHGGRAPRAVEKALAGSSRDPVKLQITVEATVQVHIGALGFAQRRLFVECELSAAGLKKDVHVLSQKCRSVFRN